MVRLASGGEFEWFANNGVEAELDDGNDRSRFIATFGVMQDLLRERLLALARYEAGLTAEREDRECSDLPTCIQNSSTVCSSTFGKCAEMTIEQIRASVQDKRAMFSAE